jgi:DNA-binding SARP family transcriptional activator
VLPLFDGEVGRRTAVCIAIARACAAKWHGAEGYAPRLRAIVEELQALGYVAVLANLPGLLAELCADALEHGFAPEFCRALVARRGLRPPDARRRRWPWTLRVRVLGDFALELDEAPLRLGAKAPSRALNVVRFLAIARDRCCALEELCEQLWPDADGDQARAACEQALHRLRRLLGRVDLVVQREGTLRLSDGHVWVDLHAWELDLREARSTGPPGVRDAARERAFWSFGGPLFRTLPSAPWSVATAERVRSEYVDLALALGRRRAALDDASGARRVYQRALELYPDSEPCYEALVRERLERGDVASALEDYRRYERVLRTTRGARPSAALAALIARAVRHS